MVGAVSYTHLLHQNKGDEHARGHIGTELSNKAETVLQVEKDEKNPGVSLSLIHIFFALCLTSFQAHAQRYLPGMKGLQVTAGMADGVHWNDNTDFAYHIGRCV